MSLHLFETRLHLLKVFKYFSLAYKEFIVDFLLKMRPAEIGK